MRISPTVPIVALSSLLGLALVPQLPARATTVNNVELTGSYAELDVDQYVDDANHPQHETDSSDFFTYAKTLHPKTVKAAEGTSSGSGQIAGSLETPGQPPFPTGPLNDIAVAATSAAKATSTGVGPAIPNTQSFGEFEVEFTTDGDVPVFFSGAALTSNQDPDDCSTVDVDLSKPVGPDETYHAQAGGDCGTTKSPKTKAWAVSETLPAGDYDLDVNWESDITNPGTPTAVATVSSNMSFYPPTADFRTKLKHSTAHFTAISAPTDPSRHIAKYVWDFGDGTTKTTSNPLVAHRYPASPKRAKTYRVTLQTIDSGGAKSPIALHKVKGTAITLKTKRHRSTDSGAGVVTPNRRHRRVLATLSVFRRGKYRPVKTVGTRLDRHSRYTVAFGSVPTGRCRMSATYPGDHKHLASTVTKRFRC